MGNEAEFFNELQGHSGVRSPYRVYHDWFADQDNTRLRTKSKEAEAFFRRTGITFNVYGQSDAEERLIPFDLVPRILSNTEWTKLAKGIDQRVRGINAFLHDLYNRQEIISAGIVPKRLIAENDAFLPQMIDFTPPGGVYTHIVGTDIVRALSSSTKKSFSPVRTIS
ncbi:MAG: circularly permuted type 2 ATP-grasp protein, partial [Pseudomonadota bacterium]